MAIEPNRVEEVFTAAVANSDRTKRAAYVNVACPAASRPSVGHQRVPSVGPGIGPAACWGGVAQDAKVVELLQLDGEGPTGRYGQNS